MGYEVLDVSGDAGIRAWGNSLGELFSEIALGMYGLMTGLEAVKARDRIEVSVKNESLDGLLIAWLNELVFRFDANGFVGRKIEIRKIDEHEVSAVISGEDFDPARHERRLLIKAATYHDLKVEGNDGKWVCEVVFDV